MAIVTGEVGKMVDGKFRPFDAAVFIEGTFRGWALGEPDVIRTEEVIQASATRGHFDMRGVWNSHRQGKSMKDYVDEILRAQGSLRDQRNRRSYGAFIEE